MKNQEANESPNCRVENSNVWRHHTTGETDGGDGRQALSSKCPLDPDSPSNQMAVRRPVRDECPPFEVAVNQQRVEIPEVENLFLPITFNDQEQVADETAGVCHCRGNGPFV